MAALAIVARSPFEGDVGGKALVLSRLCLLLFGCTGEVGLVLGQSGMSVVCTSWIEEGERTLNAVIVELDGVLITKRFVGGMESFIAPHG